MKHVVHGAKLFCPFGVKPDTLKAKKSRRVISSKKIAGVHNDNSSMINFGICTVKGGIPCTPKLTRWLIVDTTIEVQGKNPIIFPSTNVCAAAGGAVMTVTSGQKKVSKFATKSQTGEVECEWQDCTRNHIEKIEYPLKDENCIKRIDGRLLGWSKPHVYKEIYGQNNPNPNKSIRQGNNNAESYPTEQHHIIPISCIDNVPKLKNNLILLGWNINNEVLNGIVLPRFQVDIFFHDLQVHRGFMDNCHEAYCRDISAKLTKVEEKVIDEYYCENDDQYLLIDIIYNFVRNIRNKIINWDIIIYETLSTETMRNNSYDRAGLVAPKDFPEGREFPF